MLEQAAYDPVQVLEAPFPVATSVAASHSYIVLLSAIRQSSLALARFLQREVRSYGRWP
jgi:hypothetical protein